MNETSGKSNLTPVLLSVLTAIAVIGALKASYSVTMPLAFALFLITLAWPLYKWFQARLPKKAAFPLTLLALLGIFAVFVGLLFYSGKVIADAAPQYGERATKMWQKTRERAQQYDVTLPENPRLLFEGSPGSGSESKMRRGASVVKSMLSMVGLWFLTFGLLALGLHEAPKFRAKLQRGLEGTEDKSQALHVIDQVVDKCGRYFWTRSVVSVIQGVCSGLAALALGLDLPFIWGLSAALLNYLPTIGSLISVIPPTLFALFQMEEPGRAALVFFVMCFIQLGLGTFVDPLLEGRQLQISSFLVLFSIAFWGWVWGVAGALIGVPLTVTLLILCAHFDSTKWIADLLTEGGEKAEEKSPEHAT
jgi:predicted PurR-regulated permease PerM